MLWLCHAQQLTKIFYCYYLVVQSWPLNSTTDNLTNPLNSAISSDSDTRLTVCVKSNPKFYTPPSLTENRIFFWSKKWCWLHLQLKTKNNNSSSTKLSIIPKTETTKFKVLKLIHLLLRSLIWSVFGYCFSQGKVNFPFNVDHTPISLFVI